MKYGVETNVVDTVLLTCTNLISVGLTRNSLKALAQKLRNSKYLFLI
jgi:hypothetical protein